MIHNFQKIRRRWLAGDCSDHDIVQANPEYRLSLELNQARLEAGLSRKEAARRAGMSVRTVSRLESGNIPVIRQLDAIAGYFGLHLRISLQPVRGEPEALPSSPEKSARPFIAIKLPKALKAFIRSCVKSGRYKNPDEVVCHALALLQQHEEQRQALLARLNTATAEVERGEGYELQEVMAESEALLKTGKIAGIRAAQYLRTATIHSHTPADLEQRTAIREFANQNGMEIVRTYADEGKSGRNLEGRVALQQMLHDVTSGTADYEVILVYDISRWERFQDVDQSAHYENLCRQHKIRVEYCAKPSIACSPTASEIAKAVQRTMAGEHLRELSPSAAAFRTGENRDTLLQEAAERSAKMYAAIALGTEFISEGNTWRCTDKGTRTIVAIKLDKDDPSWYNGPPYTVAEVVFDEYDLEAVALSMDEWRNLYGQK